MREYKFRGKPFEDVDFDEINVHISKNDFVYGNLIIDGKVAYIVNSIVEATEEYIQLEQWIPVRPETVGQYTGLKDKNGVEIYDGDVIHERGLRETWTLSRRDEFSERKHVVIWDDGDLEWCGALLDDNEEYDLDIRPLSFLNKKYVIEIIGNIHDEVIK